MGNFVLFAPMANRTCPSIFLCCFHLAFRSEIWHVRLFVPNDTCETCNKIHPFWKSITQAKRRVSLNTITIHPFACTSFVNISLKRFQDNFYLKSDNFQLLNFLIFSLIWLCSHLVPLCTAISFAN